MTLSETDLLNAKPYFTHAELACKKTGKAVFAPGFLEKLVMLRRDYGKAMTVNSCCRSAAYNAEIGGSPRSFHVYDTPAWNTGGTCAIDIACTESAEALKLLRLAIDRGWSVGVAKTFLHLDRRTDYTDLPQGVFGY